MQPLQYSELPQDESAQVQGPHERVAKKSSRQLSLATAALLLTVALLMVIAALTRATNFQLPLSVTVEESRWLSDNRARASGDEYLLGVGKADITGPVVEINFMGYASLAQVGTGLRQRIYSRAFIMGDVSNPDDRFIYLVLDTQSGDTAIRYGILEALANLGSEYAMYTQENVAVTGTHQHSGPGAWLNYLLPQITSLGFSKQSYQAIVDGAVLSIQRAHQNLTTGYLSYGETTILDANINRSPYAYEANPAAERALYDYDVDKTLSMLRFQRASDGLNMGVLTWFSVHGTSALENNTHVTGDNKGVAAYLFEQAALTDATAADGFVAGFSQSSVGDTTPNVLGAWCDDGSGEMCTYENSTCSGTSESCHGRGPEFQKLDLGISSCYEIGRRQYAGAYSLYQDFDTVSTPIVGTSVKSFHTFQDMEYFNFTLPNGTIAETCPAALGYSFAAGTSDGPGAFDFTQSDSGDATANPLWAVVVDVIKAPGARQVACQAPKPVLLDTGELTTPYDWSPNIVDMQMLRVGQLFMVISPSEVTTMSGRRWKTAIQSAAINASITDSPIVVVGAPANTYAHYLTTEEEYGIQRYEGASTLYGPHTLQAYINVTTSNIGYLAADSTSSPAPGPSPPIYTNSSLSFITDVVFDGAVSTTFGDVTSQPNASYAIGDVVNATFTGANPRNNLRLEGTFAAVEMLASDGSTWTQVRSDADWFLSYTWYRDSTLLGTSHVDISWETEDYATAGTYRLVYYGDHKNLGGAITAFSGTSNNFTLS
ncbi:neutral nonlysosomal ceramidase-like protein [Coleophoma crateriformis]|uniref:Neutral ceramidase n=1 Tax=Coleophoma crateriformis TaxID=565419 RepID=A0A3D8QQJ4_9HELO|nr:neutral nonlysosomal ceramidase-like protein [Coleophoma crateriformis]